MISEHINPLELNEALESDREDRHDEDWHLIELAAEKWLETHPVNLCDCERSANGIGLAGRECDCPAGVRNRPQTSDSLLIECRDELERLLFNKPGNGTADLIDRLKSAPQPPASRPQEDGMREALEAERKRIAKMLNDLAMVYPPGSERMAVAIAARAAGRGRQLTWVEQLNNLKSAMAEWEAKAFAQPAESGATKRNPNACKFGGPNQACVPGNCYCWASGPDPEYRATWTRAGAKP
jgi:hypothetical protein